MILESTYELQVWKILKIEKPRKWCRNIWTNKYFFRLNHVTFNISYPWLQLGLFSFFADDLWSLHRKKGQMSKTVFTVKVANSKEYWLILYNLLCLFSFTIIINTGSSWKCVYVNLGSRHFLKVAITFSPTERFTE